MIQSQITKEEIKRLIKIDGKVRGQTLLTDFGYIKEKKGKRGIVLLKNKIKEWNAPIDYDKIKALNWYPVGFRAISLLAIKEVFNWGDEEIEKIGNTAPKYSFIVKMLIKYFFSLAQTYKNAPLYWKKHYSVGELEAPKINEKEKYLVLRLKNFKVHPILCPLLKGYFLRIAQYALGGKKATIKETKCEFNGYPYHEFIITWR